MYPIHELANIVAMASDKEQSALTADIKKNGQEDAAVLWDGFIVDGRCRQLACETLGIDLVVRTLDSKLSEEEVSRVVKSLNTRRNLTMTQKIVSAYKDQLRSNETNGEIARQWAISVPSLKNCKYLAKHKPAMMEPLFDGKSVKIMDPSKGYEITTNKVNSLARIVKKLQEVVVVEISEVEQREFSVDSAIKTEAGKAEYYKLINGDSIPNTAVATRMALVDYVNMKYKLVEDSVEV